MTSVNLFPDNYDSGGAEVKKSYLERIRNGFFSRFYSGDLVLDIGYKGSDNPHNRTVVPHAIGIDTDYPGYDGIKLPFKSNSVDCVSSSHCLEHVWFLESTIRDWYRVLKIGGFIVCIVPHKFLYEKRHRLPSIYNPDHKHFFTPARLLEVFEQSLDPNSFRVRHLRDNDRDFDYSIDPNQHAYGCYEIECVIQKIALPSWQLLAD